MITGSYDFNTVEEAFNVDLKIDLTFKKLVFAKARCSKCERYWHYDYHCLSKSRYVSIVPSDDVNESKGVENVPVPSETTSIIEDISIGFGTPILDKGHAFYAGISEIVGVIFELSTILTVDVHVSDTNVVAHELMESSVSS